MLQAKRLMAALAACALLLTISLSALAQGTPRVLDTTWQAEFATFIPWYAKAKMDLELHAVYTLEEQLKMFDSSITDKFLKMVPNVK